MTDLATITDLIRRTRAGTAPAFEPAPPPPFPLDLAGATDQLLPWGDGDLAADLAAERRRELDTIEDAISTMAERLDPDTLADLRRRRDQLERQLRPRSGVRASRDGS